MLTNHVKVGEGAEGAPVDGACLDRLDPQIVGQKHAEDGDALIVIGPCHWARDVTRDNGQHGSCNQASPSILHTSTHMYTQMCTPPPPPHPQTLGLKSHQGHQNYYNRLSLIEAVTKQRNTSLTSLPRKMQCSVFATNGLMAKWTVLRLISQMVLHVKENMPLYHVYTHSNAHILSLSFIPAQYKYSWHCAAPSALWWGRRWRWWWSWQREGPETHTHCAHQWWCWGSWARGRWQQMWSSDLKHQTILQVSFLSRQCTLF